MRNFVILDNRENFCIDVQTYTSLEDDLGLSAITVSSADSVANAVGNTKIFGIIIADNILANPETAEAIINGLSGFGVPIYGYCTREDNAINFSALNIPSLGYVRKASHLVNLVNINIPEHPTSAVQYNNTVAQPIQKPVQQVPPVQQVSPVQQFKQPVAQPKIQPVAQQPVAQPVPNQVYQNNYPNTAQYPQGNPVHYQSQSESQNPQIYNNSYQTNPYINQIPPSYPVNRPEYQQVPSPAPNQYQDNPYTNQYRTQSAENLVSDTRFHEKQERAYDEMVAEDLNKSKGVYKRTKVVTVYSAKGGVGKTTVAAELASYLSLTCKGRGKTRVCLLDYNIDFGDIRTTLGFKANDVNMSLWASVIKEKISKGADANTLSFSQKEMEETFLKEKKFTSDTEFYVLLAPTNHIDSMSIGETELTVMLRNIIDNGNFDFVICDTGNNTRDSAIIALDSADYVFLVVTQDVTTTNCNDSFISAMRKMNFDEGKIRLIINNIVSAKDTGISVSDIEDYVRYPCIAHIRHNTDVIKANNNGSPLIFSENHEFTKELRKIVAFLTGGEVKEERQKPSLWQKIFKK